MSKKKNYLPENKVQVPSDITISDLSVDFNGKVIFNGTSAVFPAGTFSD